MNRTAFAEFEDCICFNLRWVTRLVTQHYDHALADSGLRVTQLPILARLAAGPTSMAGLAEWLAMDRTTLVRNLRPLERARYVAARPAVGRRGLECYLTDDGTALLARVHPGWKAAQESLRGTIGAARWKELLSDLEAASESLAAALN